ncbi:CapA family protein [Streptococcus equi subsp. zooepidemicus]|uniref:CapA family protein n=1 Tax=Streptococcus equi TaxID=1336 RepID=UPI0013F6181A|nr:CapA family protein [Streptococcus equi]MCD3369232.1 CapA family protein [Streptococcus equi subsp. zooepidemicus]MCD3380991.1 CapA family protein [Streptococcus equi subsp. zooepidemicus]MCD3433672.1 CapA family protein [Streptococcus equi subsp. zooepidemicus]MCD3454764.1 CapA family protein [Streptococcus equi subsp. zooepidemicus]MDI5955141.1 CapA family protein [Streptococcus equi subsp. zooepidemicus]
MLKDFQYKKTMLSVLTLIVVILVFGLAFDLLGMPKNGKQTKSKAPQKTQTARVVANGDILIHDILYMSAKKADGSYDFNPYFEYVKDWISQADLAIGDYEGTISPDYPLAGYPLFNAPEAIAAALKHTGYDVVDLAHNHILDSRLEGALNTKRVFADMGIDSIGIYEQDRSKENILIKKVNGIKIAILGYSYGYNGMEATLSQEEYDKHLSDLNEDRIQKDLMRAEKEADITIVMPQMGTEYALEPTAEQKTLYRKMIDWGADVVLGGHPHVVEPAETIVKDKEKKFIIYSMGNFISNQRLETVDDIWTERGVLMDLTFEKKGQKTKIKTVKAHPTMVLAKPKGLYGSEGYELYSYRTMVLEDFIKGGRYYDKIDPETQEKAAIAYKEMNALVNLKW